MIISPLFTPLAIFRFRPFPTTAFLGVDIDHITTLGVGLGVARRCGPSSLILVETPKHSCPAPAASICVCSQDTSPVDLRDTVASYQILEMKLGFPVAKQFLIDLDAEDLREVERTAEGRNFRFPVAFAPNLQR